MKTFLAGAGVLLFFLGLVSACEPLAPSPSAQSPDPIYTAAAQTMAFELTLSAGSTAVAQLTEIASPRAPTLPPTLLPTQIGDTPTPEPVILVPPSATPLPFPCDAARFVGDVTIQTNATFTPEDRFVKTWRIRNVGSCMWTPAYTLAFAGGDALGGPLVVSLPENVASGDTVDISIELTAPPVAGTYQGYWALHNPSEAVIQITPQPLGALWVQIQVQARSSSAGNYDFTANYCAAQWLSNVANLPCPGTSSDTRGAVLLLANPQLESRKENEPAVWLRPARGQNGWISGEYPPFLVHDGDRFVAEIGCLIDSPECELDFDLDYRAADGDVVSLGSWYESYDGDTTDIDLDLSELAGETVQFILRVTNRGTYRDANAFWFVPHIQRSSPVDELVINWRLEGGVSKTCNDVKVYLTGRHSGEARIRNCKSGSRVSGDVALSKAQVDQVLDWIARFNSFQFASEIPSSGEPIDEKIVFNGEGKKEALSNDILQMEAFMLDLYNSFIF